MNLASGNAHNEYLFSGVVIRCILTGQDTGQALCLFDIQSEGHSGTPVHVHTREDETIHVLEGEMEIAVAGVTRTVRAGDAAFLPRGKPHQLKNTSGQHSRYLILCTPSGFEFFLEAVGRERVPGEMSSPPTPQEIEQMKEAAPRFGITLLPSF